MSFETKKIDDVIQFMIEQFSVFKTYLHTNPLIFNVAAIFLVIVFLLKWIRIKHKQPQIVEPKKVTSSKQHSAYILSSKDIKMVAGEDVIATQLDLARAYIELGKKQLAKSILIHVSTTGKPDQQLSAQQLMSTL